MPKYNLVRMVRTAALAGGLAFTAAAQKKPASAPQKVAPPPRTQAPAPQNQNKGGNQGRPNQNKAPAMILSPQLDRLMKMSPEERQKVLANLPADRREAIEKNLTRLDSLTPEQRAQLGKRYENFQTLPPARRQVIREEMQTLRGMTQKERRARINSEEFRDKYSPQEIQLMREVWNVPE